LLNSLSDSGETRFETVAAVFPCRLRPFPFISSIVPLCRTLYQNGNETDERESPQEAKPARENSSLGFIEAVHQ